VYEDAGTDAARARWRRQAPFVVEQTLAVLLDNPSRYDSLVSAFQSVRQDLVPVLWKRFSKGSESERRLATKILIEYLDESGELARLLLEAETFQYGPILHAVETHPERSSAAFKTMPDRTRATAVLNAELDRTVEHPWPDAPLDPSWQKPDAVLSEAL